MEQTKEITDYLNFIRKVKVLEFAKNVGNAKSAYETFGIKKSTFYKWKKAYDKSGKNGLIRKKPIANKHPNQIKAEVYVFKPKFTF